jgi:hypothetical protein
VGAEFDLLLLCAKEGELPASWRIEFCEWNEGLMEKFEAGDLTTRGEEAGIRYVSSSLGNQLNGCERIWGPRIDIALVPARLAQRAGCRGSA